MSEYRRITPDLVKEAYAKVGFKPTYGKWMSKKFGSLDLDAVCPLTAVCMAEAGITSSNKRIDLNDADVRQHHRSKIDPGTTWSEYSSLAWKLNDYMSGFTAGFDGRMKQIKEGTSSPTTDSEPTCPWSDIAIGYEDGAAVAEAIKDIVP